MLIVIGDVHGCHDELRELCDQIGPGANDRIVSVGDLVDRGPDPVAVVRLFRDTPGAAAVMGNHEDKHLRAHRGELRPAPSQLICRRQAGDAYPEILDYAATLPPCLDLPEALIVHAGFEPDLPLSEQPRNVLLRATWPGEKGLGGDPQRWTARYRGDKPIVCGHTVFEKPRVVGRTFGIDTGVYRGGRLTALVLPEERLVSVRASADHWRATRAAYDTSSERPPGQHLVDDSLAALDVLLAGLPEPRDRDSRRALAMALAARPDGGELTSLAFARDRRAALVSRYKTSAALGRALSRWQASPSAREDEDE
ncbi:MAG: metallophosphoesterase [Deltaproteobacteria bacterium]|nr:metallophosphoesterase [Deltaproteobacteria bacterium]